MKKIVGGGGAFKILLCRSATILTSRDNSCIYFLLSIVIYIVFLLMCQVCSYKTDSVTNTLHTIIIQCNIMCLIYHQSALTVFKKSRRFNIILIKLVSFCLYVCLSVSCVMYVCIYVCIHVRIYVHRKASRDNFCNATLLAMR